MGRGSHDEMKGGISEIGTVARRSRIVSLTLEEASFTFFRAVRGNLERRGSVVGVCCCWIKEM